MLELLERQKKLTANQWKIAGAATLGDMLDFFDFFLIGFVLAFVVKEWHLTYGQSGAILLASGVSAPFGSLLYGWMADKIGRRPALITAVPNDSLVAGAIALTPAGGWIYLVARRVFGGVCAALYRLARNGRGRAAAGLSVLVHSGIRAGVAALAAPPGPGG